MRAPPETFVVKLRAARGAGGIRELRAFLKLALRRFHLRCVDVREESPTSKENSDGKINGQTKING